MRLAKWNEFGKFGGGRVSAALAHPLAHWVGGGIGIGLLLGVLLLVYWRAPASMDDASNVVTFFQIGTGPSDGAYFAWGGRLSAIISRPPYSGRCEPGGPCGVKGVLAVVKSSSGSVANVRAVATHHIQSALVQSLVLNQAKRGVGAFRGEKSIKSLRAIANIHQETVFLVAGRRAAIATPADLVGKRFAVGVKGSDTDYIGLTLLRAYGIARKDVELIYAEPDRAANMFLRNQLDAFLYVASDPSPFIADLANRGTINIVPISDPKSEAFLKEHREFTTAHIADGAYRFIPALDTLAVNIIWVCDARADTALIHDLTKALFYAGNRDLLPMGVEPAYGPVRRNKAVAEEERHQLMRAATSNLVIPLHPGAEQFYRQENILAAPSTN